MKDKIVLVTGATAGIGAVTARELARMGAQVIVSGRSPARCQAVVDEIHALGGQAQALVADLSVQQEVRNLADQVRAGWPRLDVLVNNAGGIFLKREESRDGIEMTFALNHLGPFLLTTLLLDSLKASPGARVVTVASGAHPSGTINFADLQSRHRYNSYAAYAQSKLANVLFTYELARRLQGSTVTANCLHPGFVASHFARNNGWFVSAAMRVICLFAISPARGAETSIYLASSPEVQGRSGQYYDRKRAVPSSKESLDVEVARRLWEVSLQMTGLAQPAPAA
jgi:NAD(P)-dependent dehydrogenase (short-subunit alcohol dehydrogenase family)